MKKFLLAATALTAMSGVALAADLPYRRAAPAPIAAYVPPAFTWTGFYVGLNAGGAVGGDFTVSDPTGSISDRMGGFLVGGTIGYNYQLTNNIVLGIEGDLGYADIGAGSSGSAINGVGYSTKAGIDGYLGTIRGRLGYAHGPWLFYATGGWAFSEARVSTTAYAPIGYSVGSATKGINGYTVGGGVEYAVNPNLSLKAEYLYVDFEKVRAGNLTEVAIDTHLLKVGLNYKFNAF
ncbi:outer membrane protein [Enterovirga rhinocerotis]|uniref:Outer membrane immunogenic protein n=1 Tax=Enterovirga rhinocerotis TaxID=1339210 RepID=A0A4R7BKZ8_9HYPH|nr:outer membrane protein [Enterovirga rhinocerotis]TDR84546.1 outer membrane immunogenic protein [Enterovirga rhinocerotis]